MRRELGDFLNTIARRAGGTTTTGGSGSPDFALAGERTIVVDDGGVVGRDAVELCSGGSGDGELASGDLAVLAELVQALELCGQCRPGAGGAHS